MKQPKEVHPSKINRGKIGDMLVDVFYQGPKDEHVPAKERPYWPHQRWTDLRTWRHLFVPSVNGWNGATLKGLRPQMGTLELRAGPFNLLKAEIRLTSAGESALKEAIGREFTFFEMEMRLRKRGRRRVFCGFVFRMWLVGGARCIVETDGQLNPSRVFAGRQRSSQ